MRNLRKYIPILVLFVSSCITLYDAKIREFVPRIVVDGLLTDQPGPHRVRITESAAFVNGIEGDAPGISGARVYAADDLGGRIDFNESGGGYYLTDSSARGIAGRTYQLRVAFANGREYVSEPDLLRPAPPIDSIYSEYDATAKRFNIYVDITDLPTPGDGYYWKWRHYDNLFVCDPSRTIPGDPPFKTPCRYCCTRCWSITQCYTCVNIAGDQYINGSPIRRTLVATVSYDSRSRYYLLIEQRLLSPSGFRFWNSVKVQSSSTGGPFETAPAPVTGNISNTADKTEKVLGFFSVSGVLLQPYWLDRSQIDRDPIFVVQPECPLIYDTPPCAACVEELEIRTRVKPPKWDG